MSINTLTETLARVEAYQRRRAAYLREGLILEEERIEARDALKALSMKVGAFDDDLRPLPKALLDQARELPPAEEAPAPMLALPTSQGGHAESEDQAA